MRLTELFLAAQDLIIFPSDATFVPVTQAPGGRVHVLKFSSSDQRYFFWFQDNFPGELSCYSPLRSLEHMRVILNTHRRSRELCT
jgi:hypothetical protein